MFRWGKPGKAGKEQRPTAVAGEVSGPQSGGNVMPAAPFRYGANPVSRTQAARLFYATSLMSPMVRGRFRAQDKGAPTNRADAGGSFGSADLGTLQLFAGWQGASTARLGAQSGPSSQPGYPSTNNDSSVDLSGLGLPDVWRVNRL
jgi:hypothetical protein